MRCGGPVDGVRDFTGQWQHVFEDVYRGGGLEGKQWLGVLGNHDFGGFLFTRGCDQAHASVRLSLGTTSRRLETDPIFRRTSPIELASQTSPTDPRLAPSFPRPSPPGPHLVPRALVRKIRTERAATVDASCLAVTRPRRQRLAPLFRHGFLQPHRAPTSPRGGRPARLAVCGTLSGHVCDDSTCDACAIDVVGEAVYQCACRVFFLADVLVS